MSRYAASFDPPLNCNDDGGNNFCKYLKIISLTTVFVLMYLYIKFVHISEAENSLETHFHLGAKNADLKNLIRLTLQEYDADKTTKADFALESAGGRIVSIGDSTEPYEPGARCTTLLFGFIPICPNPNGPRQIIQPNVLSGECWAFKGETGSVVINLLGPVFINSVSLEHIHKSISPTGQIDTAPKEFTITGLDSEHGENGVLLGEFVYDVNGPTLQHFEIGTVAKSYEYVEFNVLSNNGNSEFTCVYRLRVHGDLDNTKEDEDL